MGDITLLRIDSNLAHSKIVNELSTEYDFDRVLIGDDELSKDSFAQRVMDLTIDPKIERSYLNLGDLKDFIREHDERFLLLVRDARALDKVMADIPIREVNIGLVHLDFNKRSLTELVAYDDYDLGIYIKARDLGIDIYIREYPKDRKKDLDEFLK